MKTKPLTSKRTLATLSGAYGAIALGFRSYPALASVIWIKDELFEYLQGWGRPNHVALTFDDGPDPISTPLILDELRRLEIKATFFMLGSMAEAYPYVAQQVAEDGHDIALHGHWHKNHLFRSTRTIRYDMERSLETVTNATGVRPLYFRPPYGVLTEGTLRTARDLSLRPVLWGAWGRDWRAKATPIQVLNDLKKRFKPGVTVLLHDSDCTSYPGSFRSTLGALEAFTNLCEQHSLSVGPLREHGF